MEQKTFQFIIPVMPVSQIGHITGVLRSKFDGDVSVGHARGIAEGVSQKYQWSQQDIESFVEGYKMGFIEAEKGMSSKSIFMRKGVSEEDGVKEMSDRGWMFVGKDESFVGVKFFFEKG